MRSRFRLPLAAAVLALATVVGRPVAAQEGTFNIPDSVVQKMMALGLQNIHRALCDGFNQCKTATPDEFENPPITLDQARMAIVVGVRSAFASWCGFDADKRSVLPFSRQLRRGLNLNDRQVALMAVIHGIQQSITAEQLKAKGACDEASQRKLESQLPKT